MRSTAEDRVAATRRCRGRDSGTECIRVSGA
ncbi:hypothetical protein ACVW0B_002872 [Thermostichus sp. MS-CIW-23]